MSEVSIKIRRNAAQGSVSPGECINLWSPLNPDGAKGVKFGTNMMGGDGSLEFSIRDRGQRGNWPAKKNDAAEVYYGLERATQHSIFNVERDELEGSLQYAGQGHFAHYAKNYLLGFETAQALTVSQVMQAAIFGGWGSWPNDGWWTFGAPFLRYSQRYWETSGLTNPSATVGYARPAPNADRILGDMLKLDDFICGIFPGREGNPDALGCYPYFRKRMKSSVDWYVKQDDIEPGGWKIELDWSKYCNRVIAYYKDAGGVVQVVAVSDTGEQNKYSPGTREEAVIDLTSLGNQPSSTLATAAATAWLNIYKNPQPKGSIVLPLKKVQRAGRGMQWSGLIRGGDVVKFERDEPKAFDETNPIDNYNAFLIDSTLVDVDAGTIELRMPEASTLETLLLDLAA